MFVFGVIILTFISYIVHLFAFFPPFVRLLSVCRMFFTLVLIKLCFCLVVSEKFRTFAASNLTDSVMKTLLSFSWSTLRIVLKYIIEILTALLPFIPDDTKAKIRNLFNSKNN